MRVICRQIDERGNIFDQTLQKMKGYILGEILWWRGRQNGRWGKIEDLVEKNFKREK